MIGAVWKARGGILLLVVLWSAGLLAVHYPVGVAAALVLLIASVWFMAALGTYASLLSRETSPHDCPDHDDADRTYRHFPVLLVLQSLEIGLDGCGLGPIRKLALPCVIPRRCRGRW